MANPEHVDRVVQGTWKKRADAAQLLAADLSGADLGGVDLANLDLRGANLRKADLTHADLHGADLSWAKLDGSTLESAHLESAILRQSVCDFANFQHADLRGTNFSGASLRNAALRSAKLHETVLFDVDLTFATGLDSCDHLGPSPLEHHTLARSQGLPVPFLRGCGLPESLIEYLPSLLNQPFEFYSCFISYSTRDQDFADRLHADLQDKGVRCWFAPHDMQGGKKTQEQIDQAIRLYDRLLLILSENSMRSEWVKTEIAHARRKELAQKRKVLFPVRLVDYETIQQWECFDSDLGEDSAKKIREFHIPNFSDWKKHDAYQGAFQRLLKDLRAESGESPNGNTAG